MKNNKFKKERYSQNFQIIALIISTIIFNSLFISMILNNNENKLILLVGLLIMNVIFLTMIFLHLKRKVFAYNLKKNGILLKTEFKEIRKRYEEIHGEGGWNTYQICSFYKEGEKIHIFESYGLRFNPFSEITVFCEYIPVYVKKDDYSKYYVDLRQIEDLITINSKNYKMK